MASNRIPQRREPLTSLATDALDGAQTHGAAVGLKQNTAAAIKADLVALAGDQTVTPAIPGAQALYAKSKTDKAAASAALRTATSNARAQVAACVDALKKPLGRHWNAAWEAAGFVYGSLAIPDDPLPLLKSLATFFNGNAPLEVPGLGATKAGCVAADGALSAARQGVNDAVTNCSQAKQTRDAALHALYERMSGLLAELGQLLDDDDARWYAFGFDRPADGEQPAGVEHLVLTGGGAGSGIVLADWDDARRAERYRVLKQIVGVDPAPVEVTGTQTESDFTFTGLPSGQTLKVTIVPVNTAGDGPSSTAEMVVP